LAAAEADIATVKGVITAHTETSDQFGEVNQVGTDFKVGDDVPGIQKASEDNHVIACARRDAIAALKASDDVILISAGEHVATSSAVNDIETGLQIQTNNDRVVVRGPERIGTKQAFDQSSRFKLGVVIEDRGFIRVDVPFCGPRNLGGQ